MKFIFFCCFLYLPSIILAQVGINTVTPQSSLDVNGTLLLRGELKLGTDPGVAGQVLTSQGANMPPKWGKYELEVLETGDYILTNIELKNDTIGLNLRQDYSSVVNYDNPLSSDWTVLDGISTNIVIKQNENRVIYTLQTVLQSPYPETTEIPSNNYLNVLCGIFIGQKGTDRSTYKLTAVREGVLKGNHYPQLGFFVISSSSNVPVGEYEILFAFQRRGGSASLSALDLYIGQGLPSGNISSDFMNRTTARVDVFEPNDR